ncbi:MAG: 50S ribosomal protein L17 [Candidatus Delongbacteria bacterium]|nr:50S ribosomal protein L17 [Candidatus Delongbacteria bacterium]
MRHSVRGRKLNRTSSHRKALFSNLTAQLFEHKQIVTTLPKAKETRKYAEKMITLGKKGDLNSLRQALKFLKQKKAVYTVFNDIAPKYMNRPGGYTRVLKLGNRKGDAAETAVIQLVEFDEEGSVTAPEPVKKAKEKKPQVQEEKPAEEVKVSEPEVPAEETKEQEKE